jgi:hypothetical protein
VAVNELGTMEARPPGTAVAAPLETRAGGGETGWHQQEEEAQ